MELTLVDYDMVHYHPSKIAAAASCLSQKVLSQGKWVSSDFQGEKRLYVMIRVEGLKQSCLEQFRDC
jgi:hypothetical protein